MLFGLTGAHGTGKSTIIKGTKEYGINVVNTSLSRIAQASLGWSDLKKLEQSEDAMWEFQEGILGAMYDRDQEVLSSRQMTLVDRTPADVWGYVSVWAQRLGGVDEDHLRDFKNRCRVMATRYTQQIIVPISDAVPFVAEAGRADLESRDYHEKAVCQFIMTGSLPHMVLLQTGIDERIKKVVVLMNTISNNLKRFQEHDDTN
jgi:predicted ATPase